MMTVLKTTQIWLERITKIEVEDDGGEGVLDMHRRSLTIWTEGGDKYEPDNHLEGSSIERYSQVA
jgi:hypothetical protein